MTDDRKVKSGEDGDDSTDIDPAKAEKAAANAKRRKSIYDLLRQTLPSDQRNYAVANVLDEPLFATYDALDVTSHGGSPGVVAGFLSSISALLDELGGAFIMRELDFRHSVSVKLEPVIPAVIREEASRLAEKDPEGVLNVATLERLIPDAVVTANVAARLLDATSTDGLALAKRLGGGAPNAYLRVAKIVQEQQGKLVIAAPGNRTATFSERRAKRVVEAAKEPEPLDPIKGIKISGALTRTDSEEKTFRVVLDRDRLPDIFDARRRNVEGQYTSRAGGQVSRNNLWDSRVLATVTAYPVRDPLHAKPILSRFEFTDVKAARN